MVNWILHLVIVSFAFVFTGLVMNGRRWYSMHRIGFPVGRDVLVWFGGSVVGSLILNVTIVLLKCALMDKNSFTVQAEQSEQDKIIVFSVSATLDNHALRGAIVELDGEDVGFTPYQGTVTSDEDHYLMVIPPDDQEFAEGYCEWKIPKNWNGQTSPCQFTSLQ